MNKRCAYKIFIGIIILMVLVPAVRSDQVSPADESTSITFSVKKSLAPGEKWDLGGGYSIYAQAIDAKAYPRQVWLVLFRNGEKLDDKVLSEGRTLVYDSINIKINSIYAGAITDVVELSLSDTSDWPMFKYDPSNSGFTPEKVEPPLRLLWKYKTENPIYSSPIVANGTVYIGSGDEYLYSLDTASGKLKWKYKLGSYISSPAFGNGFIYVSAHLDGCEFVRDSNVRYKRECDNLFILDENGTLIKKYSFELWGTTSGNPELAVSSPVTRNNVVFTLSGNFIAILNSANNIVSKYYLNGVWGWQTKPAVTDNIFYFSSNNYVYAWYIQDGRLKWQAKTDTTSSSPALYENKIYVGSDSGHVYALDSESGKVVWTYQTEGPIASSPSIANGFVYIGSKDGYLYAIYANTGGLKWRYQTGGAITSSPSVSGNTVYVGSKDNNIYAIDSVSGVLKWQYKTSGVISSSPAISNGILYISSWDNYIYAFIIDPETTIQNLRPSINSLKAAGANVTEAEQFLLFAQQALGNEKYVEANYYVNLAKWNAETANLTLSFEKKQQEPVKTVPQPTISKESFTNNTSAKVGYPVASETESTLRNDYRDISSGWVVVLLIIAVGIFYVIRRREYQVDKFPKIGIKRTVYDPTSKGFVSEKKLDFLEVSKWLDAHPPPDYWYILRIDSLGSAVEQWAIELETHIALSIKEAYLDGFERSFQLNREHIQWKDKYILRVPKELGIPLPSNGTRRLYFRLNIDCTTALLPRYAISGRVIVNGSSIPIPEKDFPFSCELRKLKEVWTKKPKEVEKYVDSKARELYSLDAARAIADALRLYNEINKLVEQEYVEENKLRNSIKNLRASLENVKASTGVERPLELIDESFAVMETVSVELAIKRWKEMNLFDVMMTELLKGGQ